MKDTLLTIKHKLQVRSAIAKKDYVSAVLVLDPISTKHAGTAKMKDKRFVIKEIVKSIIENPIGSQEKMFFEAGKKILRLKSNNAKEIGIHVLHRAYSYNKKKVEGFLYKITDDDNWEVREYAAGALAETLKLNPGFYSTLRKWTKDRSENIRRGVVLAAVGLRDRKDPVTLKKAFSLLEPLLYDSSMYVRKNLGPFILGSYFGNAFPEEMFMLIGKMIRVKNVYVRWNAAMAFNNSFGNRYPKEAVKFLRLLINDESPVVKRAVRSTLNHLSKRHKIAGILSNYVG